MAEPQTMEATGRLLARRSRAPRQPSRRAEMSLSIQQASNRAACIRNRGAVSPEDVFERLGFVHHGVCELFARLPIKRHRPRPEISELMMSNHGFLNRGGSRSKLVVSPLHFADRRRKRKGRFVIDDLENRNPQCFATVGIETANPARCELFPCLETWHQRYGVIASNTVRGFAGRTGSLSAVAPGNSPRRPNSAYRADCLHPGRNTFVGIHQSYETTHA